MRGQRLVQLVLVELALAAAAGGLALGHVWRFVGGGVAVVLLALALVSIRRRWLYQIVLAWLNYRRRRRAARSGGLRAVLDDFEIVSVPLPNQDSAMGAVRSGTTWTLPLEALLDGVLNDDAPVSMAQLVSLFRVEDVRLASVRLMTVAGAAWHPPNSPAGPVVPHHQIAARYILLTLDTASSTDAVADRGGSDAAVQQILRRCALRAEQTLGATGVRLRRLDPTSTAAVFASVLGTPAGLNQQQAPTALESWNEIRVDGTWSTTFALSGAQPDTLERLSSLVSSLAAPLAVTTVLLRPGSRGTDAGDVETTVLLRLSGPLASTDRTPVTRAVDFARATGLVLQRLSGEQGALLRATTPAGVGRYA